MRMTGWEPVEVRWIVATLQALPRPWPNEAVLMWLRYAAKAVSLGREVETPSQDGPWTQRRTVLGQRELAAATGRKWWDIRKLYEAREWADPLSHSTHKILTPPSHDPHASLTRARDLLFTESPTPTPTPNTEFKEFPANREREPVRNAEEFKTTPTSATNRTSTPATHGSTPAPALIAGTDPLGLAGSLLTSRPPPNPSPPLSASPAAHPQGISGEGSQRSTQAPLWPQGSAEPTRAAPTPPAAPNAPQAPQRRRKSPPADPSAGELYRAWRTHHPRAPEAPTPDTARTLGRLLVEAGGLSDALLLVEWAHTGTCERARQLQGAEPWPDGRLKALTDLESLSRHVAGRLEMARRWRERSTDPATGLRVIEAPPQRATLRSRASTADLMRALNEM